MTYAFIISVCILLVSFFMLQRLKQQQAHQGTQKIPAFIGGLAAWSVVIMLATGLFKIVQFTYHLFTAPAAEMAAELMAGAFAFVGGLIGVLMVFRLSQIIDTFYFREFFVHSLAFRAYEIKRDDVFVELEQHVINQVRKETSDTQEAADLLREKKIKKHDPEQLRKELARQKHRPVQSIHLVDEVQRLGQGEEVNISDSWHMNSLRSASHPLYLQISEVRISPAGETLSFRVIVQDVQQEELGDSQIAYRLKQDLYDVLQAIRSEEWMRPYARFFHSMSVKCYATRLDSFGQPLLYPFITIDVRVDELEKLEGHFFDVGNFGKIAKVVFNGGEPV
ncbi:MAG: hypothetical protein ABSF91_02880 [Bacteroidota bacterium]|jgi:hypothetical protein